MTRPKSSALIESLLSRPRFEPYLLTANNDVGRAVELYEWNLSLSTEFWKIIAITEITLRNAMHEQLTQALGQNWYEDPNALDDRSLQALAKAKTRARRGLPQGGQPPHGKVVSEVTFGSWVALLDKGGRSTALGKRVNYRATLWDPALQYAFPHGPGHQKKTNRGLRTIQELRNRIGHHEKIFMEPYSWTSHSLGDLHQHCLEVTSWVSLEARDWAASVSRIDSVIQARPC